MIKYRRDTAAPGISWYTYDALGHVTFRIAPMLDLLPYLCGVEGQESYDQEVCCHVSQRLFLGPGIFVPMAGPRYTLVLYF